MFRTLALTSVLVVCLCSGQRNFGRNNDRSQDSRFRPTLQRPPPVNDLPIFEPYNPEKAPQVPIRLGERSKAPFLRLYAVNKRPSSRQGATTSTTA